MKKRVLFVFCAALMAVCLLAGCGSGASGKKPDEEVKLGVALTPGPGKMGVVLTVAALQGDKIVACYVDDFQFFDKNEYEGISSSDGPFGENYVDGKVLGSVRDNNETYSKMLADLAGGTSTMVKNWGAVQKFCTGKTISELKKEIEGYNKDNSADAVSGCTFQDPISYVRDIINAIENVDKDAISVNNK